MKQTGIRCMRCMDEIFSNSRHDFVSCSCGAHFIDGGFDYIRSGGLGYIPSEMISRDVNKETLRYYYRDEAGKKNWSREMSDLWNKEHWDLVGEAVTKRLEWWEKVRDSEGYRPLDGSPSKEIDI